MTQSILVSNLSKLYKLGEVQSPSLNLREDIQVLAGRLFRKNRQQDIKPPSTSIPKTVTPRFLDCPENHFWAIKDINFSVDEGQTVGIVGRNGAGKSTLLKILSRITHPTSGHFEFRGRMSSLLEVGTGFHRELTGRENVFLNGSILGMRRQEIKSKLDEIITFAEVERFVDTPVKHYSSGMYLRLAFSVAAHLYSDILLVDEVLAVGDSNFQKKCLGKMEEVAQHGRTVIFVSHNMPAIRSLCQKTIWIDQGQVKQEGETSAVIEAYLSCNSSTDSLWEHTMSAGRIGNEQVQLLSVRLTDQNGVPSSELMSDASLFLEIIYEIFEPVKGMQIAIRLSKSDGTIIFVGGDRDNQGWFDKVRPAGRYKNKVMIPPLHLNAGGYLISAGFNLINESISIMADDIISMNVRCAEIPSHSAHGNWSPPGILCLSLDWSIEKIEK